jgi:hypothetical protein
MDDFCINPPLVVKYTPKARRLACLTESIPTSVCGGERSRVIGRSPGESRSQGQNDHGLAQHSLLSFDATARRVIPKA